MGLFKKKLFEKKMVTLQKFRTVFTTVDGNVHLGVVYNYVIAERLACSVPEWIMIDIRSDGYIMDHRYVMYPLTNIVSIDWKLEYEKVVEDKFGAHKIYVTAEELEK